MIKRTGRRQKVGGWLCGGAIVVATVTVGGTAFANAPNPTSTTDAATTTNPDGTVTVKIGGTWDWGEEVTEPDEKSSPQKDCTQRYGVGWAVDWQDKSVAPWNDPATLKTYTITKNGVSFAAQPDYSGFQVGLCGQKDADGFPTGPWSATHTYPNAASVPKVLCVNFYDPHGKEGKPSGGVGWPEVNQIPLSKRSSDFIATGPRHQGDNSIETNNYDPSADGHNCATPHPAAVAAAAKPAAPAPAPAPSATPTAAAQAPQAAPVPTQVLGISVPRSPTAQAVAAARVTFTG